MNHKNRVKAQLEQWESALQEQERLLRKQQARVEYCKQVIESCLIDMELNYPLPIKRDISILDQI